jgi:hypothetical protein
MVTMDIGMHRIGERYLTCTTVGGGIEQMPTKNISRDFLNIFPRFSVTSSWKMWALRESSDLLSEEMVLKILKVG